MDKKLVGIVAGVLLVLFVGGILIVKLAMQDDPGKRKRQIQMVTLVAPPPPPPPPPEIEEPPPEPEEEIIEEPEDQQQEEAPEESSDEPPPGPDLGVDAEGGAGGDSFGLVGKKGGRSLIGSDSSLLHRFAWYTRIVQEELQEKIKRYMQDNGGIPDDKVKAIVVISVDPEGRIIRYKTAGQVENIALDKALRHVLPETYLSEPPPVDMPRKIKLKISFKG